MQIRKMKHTESCLQINCVRWFRMQYPEPRYLLFAIPNGGNRNLITATIMKREGCRAGVPDICILAPGKIFFIEMKSEKGKLNDNQKEVTQMLRDMGYYCYECRSLDEFMKLCNNHILSSALLNLI